MDPSIAIKPANLSDAAEIAALYAHHVIHGVATFETVPPDAAEIAGRMGKVADAGWPWLVARDGGGNAGGAVLGYAYATQIRERAAYRYTCENSIYLRHDCTGRGIGKALLAALLDACEAAGFRQMIAVIAGTEPASIALHASAGFAHAGHMRSTGRKHGQWIDVIYMQRALGDGDSTPPPEEPA